MWNDKSHGNDAERLLNDDWSNCGSVGQKYLAHIFRLCFVCQRTCLNFLSPWLWSASQERRHSLVHAAELPLSRCWLPLNLHQLLFPTTRVMPHFITPAQSPSNSHALVPLPPSTDASVRLRATDRHELLSIRRDVNRENTSSRFIHCDVC